MLSNFNLDKLLQHNFIDSFTRDELIRVTQPSITRWSYIKSELESIISSIQKHELERPLGISNQDMLWVGTGYWNCESKLYHLSSDSTVTLTLEELINFHKLMALLTAMDHS